MNVSIIIPFVNEKEEVLSTIESIEQYSSEVVYEIILINDASDDEYNYKEILSNKSKVTYYENKHRIGVAACRDMGILLSHYEVFLFLDAHMRFYTQNTLHRFLEVLSEQKNVILCCHTTNIGDPHYEKTPFGAYLELGEGKGELSPVWNTKDVAPNDLISPVPCILGAAYAAYKDYWFYLRGLEGLVSYGSDEAYISLKVWLSGGRCLILKDITVGHLYRKNAPYSYMGIDFVYNKIWVALLTLPDHISLNILNKLKETSSVQFNLALCSFYKNISNFIVLKEHYQKILTKPFTDFFKFNNECKCFTNSTNNDIISPNQNDEFLSKIISGESNALDLGLYNGKMGAAIYLYLYNRKAHNPKIEEIADGYIDEVIANIETSKKIELSFSKGLFGISWGLSFLTKEELVSGNINEILSDFDDIIFNTFDIRCADWSFNTGMIGLTYYSLMRLQQDESVLKRFPLFFILLTKVIKQRYIYEFANLDETRFPIIALLYLCFIENRYNIIKSLTSFISLKSLSNINNDNDNYFKESTLMKNIAQLLFN